MPNVNYEVVKLLSNYSFYEFTFSFMIVISIFALVAWGIAMMFKFIETYLDDKRVKYETWRVFLISLAVIIILFVISFSLYYKKQTAFFEIKELERILEYKLL